MYGIADSPVGLAAWLLDRGDGDGQPAAGLVSALARTTSDAGELTREEFLDNVTLYWLTNTGVSASRLDWEYKGGFFNVDRPVDRVVASAVQLLAGGAVLLLIALSLGELRSAGTMSARCALRARPPHSSLVRDDRVHLELHQPSRIDEA